MIRNELLIFYPQKEFYGGEEVSGYVELKNVAPLTITEVNIQFLGCEFAELESKKEGNVFLKHESVLQGDGSKDRGKDFFGYKVKGQPTTLNPGAHRYNFRVQLTESLPPSFQCSFGKIVYELRATAVSGVKGIQDLVSCAIVPVGGSLFDLNFMGNNSVPFSVTEHKSFLLASGFIDYVASLESKVFLTGDVIKCCLDFQNKSSKTVKPLSARLMQRVEIHMYGKLQKVDEITLATKNIGTLESKQNKNSTIELVVPATVPESTFKKEIGKKKKSCGKNIQIHYMIVIHGEISMAVDLHCELPIYIARRERQAALGNNAALAPQQPSMLVPPQSQEVVAYEALQSQAPPPPQPFDVSAANTQQPYAYEVQPSAPPSSFYPSLYPSESNPQAPYYPSNDPIPQPLLVPQKRTVPPPPPSHLVMQQQIQQMQMHQEQPPYSHYPSPQGYYLPQQQQQQQPPLPQAYAAPLQQDRMTAQSSSNPSEIYDEFFNE